MNTLGANGGACSEDLGMLQLNDGNFTYFDIFQNDPYVFMKGVKDS